MSMYLSLPDHHWSNIKLYLKYLIFDDLVDVKYCRKIIIIILISLVTK